MKTLQAKDLRIGNYLHELCDNKKEVISVKEIHSGDFRFAIITNKDELISSDFFEPIELTEEILVKCGYGINDRISASSLRDKSGCKTYSCNKGIDVILDNGVFKFWNYIDEDTYYSFAWTELPYLHTLQNLSFALKGNELEVKL